MEENHKKKYFKYKSKYLNLLKLKDLVGGLFGQDYFKTLDVLSGTHDTPNINFNIDWENFIPLFENFYIHDPNLHAICDYIYESITKPNNITTEHITTEHITTEHITTEHIPLILILSLFKRFQDPVNNKMIQIAKTALLQYNRIALIDYLNLGTGVANVNQYMTKARQNPTILYIFCIKSYDQNLMQAIPTLPSNVLIIHPITRRYNNLNDNVPGALDDLIFCLLNVSIYHLRALKNNQDIILGTLDKQKLYDHTRNGTKNLQTEIIDIGGTPSTRIAGLYINNVNTQGTLNDGLFRLLNIIVDYMVIPVEQTIIPRRARNLPVNVNIYRNDILGENLFNVANTGVPIVNGIITENNIMNIRRNCKTFFEQFMTYLFLAKNNNPLIMTGDNIDPRPAIIKFFGINITQMDVDVKVDESTHMDVDVPEYATRNIGTLMDVDPVSFNYLVNLMNSM
jgi:hypothetical protein